MSVILRCNVFSVLYQANRRSLSPNLTNLLRRNVALNSEVSDPNGGNVKHKSNILLQYARMMQGELYSELLGAGDISKMKSIVYKSESLTSIKSLLFLKCCGTVAVDVKPEIRVKYLHNIWDYIKTSGVPLDISHYNAFLKAHIENEKPLDDKEFIENMKLNDITPNRVTYQHFLTYYCYTGELGKATKILEEMKEKNINLNENIFNALILGHAVANDIDGAEDILQIMRDKELAIDSSTYFMYLCGLACSGNLNKIDEILKKCSSDNIEFSGKKLLDIVYYLIINGHKDYGLKMLSEINIPSDSKDAIIFQFRLLHKKEYDTLLDVLNLNSESTDQLRKLKLTFRYLKKNEDLRTILKFKDVCNQKGIKTDWASSLIQHVKYTRDSNTSLKSLYDYYKAEGSVKFSFFVPFINKYVKEGKTVEITETIKTLLSCNKKLKLSFFLNKIVDKLKLNTYTLIPFIESLNKAGLPYSFLIKAYVINILKDGNLQLLTKLTSFYNLPSNIELYKFDLVETVHKGHATVAAFYLKHWLSQAVYEESERLTKSPEEKDGVYNLELYQDVFEHYDDIFIEIFKSYETEHSIKFFKELIKLEVPVSRGVAEFIRSSLKTEEIGELVDKLNTSTLELDNEIRHKFSRSSKYNIDRDSELENTGLNFKALIDSGNLIEAEQLLKETPSLQCYSSYEILIQALDEAGEEQKIIDYLDEFWIVEGNSRERTLSFYLELETIKRKLFNHARQILLHRRRYLKPDFLQHVIPIVKEFSDEDLWELLGIRLKTKSSLLVDNLFMDLFKQSDSDFILRLCKIACQKTIISSNCMVYNLIPYLYATDKLNIIKDIDAMVETKTISFLIARCLCTGDIVNLRNILDTGINVDFSPVKFVEGIPNDERRVRMIKEILSFSKEFNLYLKNVLYEMLIEHYKEIGEKANKCMELWYDQQEENLEPTKLFFIHLADVCKANDMSVDFEIPELLPGSFPKLNEYPRKISRYLRRCLHGLQNLDSKEGQLGVLEALVRSYALNFEEIRLFVNVMNNETSRLGELLKYALELCKCRKAFFQDFGLYVKEMEIDTPKEFMTKTPVKFLASLYTRSTAVNETGSILILWFYWSKIKPNPKLAEFIASYVSENKNKFFIKSPFLLRAVPLHNREEFSLFLRDKARFLKHINLKDADQSFKGTAEDYEETPNLSPTLTETDGENTENMNDIFQYDAHKSNNKEMEENGTPQSNTGP